MMTHRVVFRRNGCFIESTEYPSYERADAKATRWENISLKCDAEIQSLGPAPPAEEKKECDASADD